MKAYAKIRKKLLCVLVGLFTVCLFSASVMSSSTQAKYVFEASDSEAKIEISVQNQINITSVAQFVTAIENGYSNIKIDDSVASPLLFLGDELDLKADLVIDLNGHELQRSGSDAMVNVPEGITLTIYDSDSTNPDSIASLYNPIGSVIEVAGGSLSLVGGKVESGVRANEYSTYNKEDTHGSVSGALTTGTLYTKYLNGSSVSSGELNDDGYYEQADAVLPKISAATITSGNYTLLDGNIYVPAGKTLSSETYTFDTNNPLSDGGDYYLYYMNELNTYTAVSSGASDFYYTYTENGEEITICGFYKNFSTADEASTIYAAIEMESGKLNVFGGEYCQYFGVDNNYCVYASGGDMTVYGGAFVAEGYSTCLGCNFTSTDVKGSLNVKAGEFTSYLGDGIRVSGYAKLINDADDMTVTGGTFTKIADQELTVWKTDESGGGSFQTVDPGDSNSIYYDANGSAINMVSGKLTVAGKSENSQDDLVKFTLYGGGINGIKCGAGAFVDCKCTEFLFNCDYDGNEKTSSDGTLITAFTHNIGILNYEGTVTADCTLFRLNTAYNVGIYSVGNGFFTKGYEFSSDSSSGSVTVTSSVFSIKGEKSIGVLATRGTVTLGSQENLGTEGQDRYAMFYIDHVTDCFGVYVAGVDKTSDFGTAARGKVDLSGDDNRLQTEAGIVSYAVQFYLGQEYYDTEDTPEENSYYTSDSIDASHRIFNSCGIYLNGNSVDTKITLYRTVLFAAGSYTAGIFVRNGTVEQGMIGNTTYKFGALMGVTVNDYADGGEYYKTSSGDHSLHDIGHYREKFGMTWYVAQYGADNYTSEQIFDVAQANAKACYGLITFGGDIKLYKCFLGIYSTWSSGIYSSGGTVDIIGYDTSGNGLSDEGFECKLITLGASATDDSTAIADIAANTNIASPFQYGDTKNRSCLITSCVVRMNVTAATDTENSGSTATDTVNRVYIAAGKITTDNYGFYIEGGNLFFGSKYTLGITKITGYRAPAVVLKNGNISVYGDDTLEITDTLNNKALSFTYTDANGNGQTVTGSYQDFTAAGTIPTDAVYVSGGNFAADGTLNITFKGLENDEQTDTTTYAPLDNLIKSYAVDVVGGSVTIGSEAQITVSVGGGILANGGSVTLGAESATVDNSKIKIETTGNEWYDTLVNGGLASNSNWQYYVSKTGGHAVRVRGGNVTIYYGTYTAALGNGIFVSNGNATVYDGIYYGLNASYKGDNINGSGLGAYYGLMLYNNGTFTSYGGTFAGANGGAFVHGTSGKPVTANIYAGAFVKAYESTQTTTNGFSIGSYATVTFGGANGAADLKNAGDILVGGVACGIAVESNGALGTLSDVNLYIYGGTYSGTRTSGDSNAIWNGNSNATITLADCRLYGYSAVVCTDNDNVSAADGYTAYYVSGTDVAECANLQQSGYVIVSSGKPNTDGFIWKKYIAYSLSDGFYYASDNSYIQSTGNFAGDETQSYTIYTRHDGVLTYYFDNVFWFYTGTKIASGNDNGDATYNKAATVIVYANEALTFETNWGMWNDGTANSGGYGTLTAKYYDKDGNLKTTTSGSSTYQTTSWTLSEGEYIVFEYTPPDTVDSSDVELKFDLQNIAVTLEDSFDDYYA